MGRLALSHSALELFESCPLRFKTERIDKIKGEPSLPMALGSFVHEITDQYFKHLVKTGQRSDFAMAESIAQTAWVNRRQNADWAMLPESLYEDMLGLVYAIREECVIDPRQVVSSEQSIAFNEHWKPVKWLAKDVFFRAKIDRLELTQDLVAIVWDLKTGRKIDKDANTPQMRRYAFVVTKLLPEAVKIVAQLYYPRKRALFPTDFEPGAVAGMGEEITRASDEIEAMRAKNEWPATPSFLACQNCPAFATCPAKVRATNGKIVQPERQDEAERLVERLVFLNQERDTITDALKHYVDVNGPVEAAGMLADYSVQHKLSWDTEELCRVLREVGLEPLRFLKGDSKLLAREVRKNEALHGRIDAITRDRPSTRFILRQAGDDGEDEDNEKQ
ncbi:MAG: PD-(D/E)XK nuclease family protein [Verrucomicrobiota bacterium]|nr:PD-(D/E)XK nuclease family protein [Verrucomicrobiota bacterium]